ncbi:hypothetical protein GcC1_058011 [Golovinomyces cichoracearum]|uniref:t-SNARE coiled-coil homology domain-containing protein n=1 Tax=Golovinomyces cichoracearum TaxID=62708 RepID=A0A420IUH8_9PEZI|nr:hypothetical protein GcC1_058011 [Golovinomyces cichoracearum]
MVFVNQYFQLIDHIKLSLLERRSAVSVDSRSASHDSNISRSLETLREGIEKVYREQATLQESGDTDASYTIGEIAKNLQAQHDDLMKQYQCKSQLSGKSSLTTHLNDADDLISSGDLAEDTLQPQVRMPSTLKTSFRGSPPSQNIAKSVRFSDSSQETDQRNHFPYRDDPCPGDNSHLDNQQVYSYHSQVIQQQDEVLDRLGRSIGRQRELSIQIGDELNEHAVMLDDIDRHVDRHQTRLKRTMKGLEKAAKNAKENKQFKVIASLIAILIALIIILRY